MHYLSLPEYYTRSESVDRIYTDDNEWSNWKSKGDPILHIDLGNWADVMLIAPLDANTLAKTIL